MPLPRTLPLALVALAACGKGDAGSGPAATTSATHPTTQAPTPPRPVVAAGAKLPDLMTPDEAIN